MEKPITIADFSPHLFWDVDLDGFDFEKHSKFFAQRVTEYGLMKDWNLLKRLYGLEKIKQHALQFRSLDAVSLSFLATIFQTDKSEFRCYKHRQLVQNCWNS